MNKEYFIASSSGVQTGPYTLDQLNELGITAGTLVWCEGMPNWAKAGEVPHLQHLFKKVTPPPLHLSIVPQSQSTTIIHEVSHKTNPLQKWIYMLIIVCVILLIVLFAFYNDYEALRRSYNSCLDRLM